MGVRGTRLMPSRCRSSRPRFSSRRAASARCWSGAFIGLAALARLPVAAAAPALALLLAHRAGTPYPRALAGVVLGGVPFALVYVGYELLRWGSLFDSGYLQLTEGDVFFTRGLFSPFYLPRHFDAIFLEPPDFVAGTPFFRARAASARRSFW